MSERSDAIALIKNKCDEFSKTVNITRKQEDLSVLEEKMNEGDFWDNQDLAQETIAKIKTLKNIIEPYETLSEEIDACSELLELAEMEEDTEEDDLLEIESEIKALSNKYDKLEIKLALSGEHDSCNIYLSIQAGAGGTESCDWADMLLRMYTAYCQKAGYKANMVDYHTGEEAGIKSCTIRISGDMVYGYFKSEMGTHRLVRMSPFNSQGKRQTSFAAVEVTPELPDSEVINMENIDEKEFRIDTFRASGAGGQHINKTDSAVRITHIETNITSSCQSERSQTQNKAQAWKMILAKLQQVKDAERLSELQDLMGERGTVGWGHQIRSYVLQPTQLITDLRSRHKESNALSVLDGDLQPFIDEYLRFRLKQDYS